MPVTATFPDVFKAESNVVPVTVRPEELTFLKVELPETSKSVLIVVAPELETDIMVVSSIFIVMSPLPFPSVSALIIASLFVDIPKEASEEYGETSALPSAKVIVPPEPSTRSSFRVMSPDASTSNTSVPSDVLIDRTSWFELALISKAAAGAEVPTPTLPPSGMIKLPSLSTTNF